MLKNYRIIAVLCILSKLPILPIISLQFHSSYTAKLVLLTDTDTVTIGPKTFVALLNDLSRLTANLHVKEVDLIASDWTEEVRRY